MHLLLLLILLNINLSYADVQTKFNVTIQTPGNDVPIGRIPYKSIHVKYSVPNKNDRWNIVAIDPFTQKLKEVIQQITVHICQISTNIKQPNAIWYDDDAYCNGARSMLIYQWIFYSGIPNFRISDDLGFQLDKTRFLVLSIKYFREQQSHDNQLGVILSVSTLIPKFNLGTIFVGNKQRGIRSYQSKSILFRIFLLKKQVFSCRSLNYPRLLYAVKPLFPKTINESWRIHVVRSRNFGRKSIELVINSTIYSPENRTDLAPVSLDMFLIPADYFLVDCSQSSAFQCQFLIYYTYKNLPYKFFEQEDHTCQADHYPDLFKLLPEKRILPKNQTSSRIEGTTIFLLICMLLFIAWMSIICGCIIMRRIRGLASFRSDSSTPRSAQSTKAFFPERRAADGSQQKLHAEADRTAQLDIEHMGLMC